jgi:hypothetical protein
MELRQLRKSISFVETEHTVAPTHLKVAMNPSAPENQLSRYHPQSKSKSSYIFGDIGLMTF